MRAVISEYNESALCLWCNRTAEGVTVEFDDGFLKKGHLCWRCLTQATRVHNQQATDGNHAPKAAARGRSDATD
jgi:hypothetical protein